MLFGAFICLMFCVPHSSWRNQYALAAAALFFVLLVICVPDRKAEGGLSVKEGFNKVLPSDLGLPVLLFCISLLASLLFTQDLADSLRVLAFFASALIIMWSAAAVLGDRNRLYALLCWIYAAVLITSLFAVFQRISGVEASASQTDLLLNSGLPGRVYSTLENPNNYAEFLVLFTPLCTGAALNAKKASARLLMSLGLIFPLTALVMTYSRSGWLSAALTLVIFVYFTKRSLLPWLLVLSILALPFLPSGVVIRLSNLFNTADTSADYRLRIWQTSFRLLSDQGRWLTGIGLGPSTLAKQIELFADDYVLAGIVHSQMLYIELFVETGLLGFVSFIWMMISETAGAAKRIFSCEDRLLKTVLSACAASFAGMALFGIFEYLWFYPRVLFAFFLLLGIMKAAAAMAGGGRDGY